MQGQGTWRCTACGTENDDSKDTCTNRDCYGHATQFRPEDLSYDPKDKNARFEENGIVVPGKVKGKDGDVWIKIINRGQHQRSETQIKREANIMASIQHENVLQLLGTCITEQQVLLVTEYVPATDLETLVESGQLKRDNAFLLKLFDEIARGMDFVHICMCFFLYYHVKTVMCV